MTIAGSLLLALWSPLVVAEPSVDQTTDIIIRMTVYGLIAAFVVYVSIRQRRTGKSW